MNPELTIQPAPTDKKPVDTSRRTFLKGFLGGAGVVTLAAIGPKTAEVATAAPETPAATTEAAEMVSAAQSLGIDVVRQSQEATGKVPEKAEIPEGFTVLPLPANAVVKNVRQKEGYELWDVKSSALGEAEVTFPVGAEPEISGVTFFDADSKDGEVGLQPDGDLVTELTNVTLLAHDTGLPGNLVVVKYADAGTWQRVDALQMSSVNTDPNKVPLRDLSHKVGTNDDEFGTWAYINGDRVTFDDNGHAPVTNDALVKLKLHSIKVMPGLKKDPNNPEGDPWRDSTHFVPVDTETATPTATETQTVEATPPAETVTPTKTPEAPATPPATKTPTEVPPQDQPPLAETAVAEPSQPQLHKVDVPIAFGPPNK